jgi:hypothetical protein
MATATVLLAAILGFRFYGVDGTCLAAAIAWVFCAIGSSVIDARQLKQAREVSDASDRLRQLLTSQIQEICNRLPATCKFYDVILDSLPLEPYEWMELHTPRTQEAWERTWQQIWPRLRRRLVHGYGLTEKRVDDAKSYIMDQHATQNPLPHSDAELAAMIAGWREAADWATRGTRNRGDENTMQ